MSDTPAFRFDFPRAARTGIPEAVLYERKSPAQIAAIAAEFPATDLTVPVPQLSARHVVPTCNQGED